MLDDEEGDLHLPHYLEIMGGVVFLGRLEQFEERMRKAVARRRADDRGPVTVGPDATAHEAARLIAAQHHNRLPVVEHGR